MVYTNDRLRKGLAGCFAVIWHQLIRCLQKDVWVSNYSNFLLLVMGKMYFAEEWAQEKLVNYGVGVLQLLEHLQVVKSRTQLLYCNFSPVDWVRI